MSWDDSEPASPGELLARMAASTAAVRLVALPTSRHSSHLRAPPGTPQGIVRALCRDEGNPFTENGHDLSDSRLLQSLGALDADVEDDVARIRTVAAAAFAQGRRALFVGGDHAVTYPIVAGLHDARGPVTLVHVDAHPDLYDELGGDRHSHACPFARIMESGLAAGLWQYGIRTLNPHQRAQVTRFGVHCGEMRERAHWRLPPGPGPFYVSIDLDGLDPAFAPGVAHREPGGLNVREVLDLVAALPGPVIGADVVEYLPQRDVDGLTQVVAAKLVRELAGRLLADRA